VDGRYLDLDLSRWNGLDDIQVGRNKEYLTMLKKGGTPQGYRLLQERGTGENLEKGSVTLFYLGGNVSSDPDPKCFLGS